MKLTIEQMREIVAGAPQHTQIVILCSDGVMYFAQRDDGKWFRYSNSYEKWLEYWGKCDPMDLAVKLDVIRTAIADYDRTDHVTDIRNHISPNTRVSEAHVNEAFKLNSLG